MASSTKKTEKKSVDNITEDSSKTAAYKELSANIKEKLKNVEETPASPKAWSMFTSSNYVDAILLGFITLVAGLIFLLMIFS